VELFFVEWRGTFPQNVPSSLGRLRKHLALPEALLAKSPEGGTLLLASAADSLTEERIIQALRLAVPLSPDDTPDLITGAQACKAFLLLVCRLRDQEVETETGYLNSLQTNSLGRTIHDMYSLGLKLREKLQPYLRFKTADKSTSVFFSDISRKVLGHLSRATIYLLGCPPEALAFAQQLLQDGASNFLVTSSDQEHAVRVTRHLPAEYSPPELAPDRLRQTDIAICSDTACCRTLKAHHFMIASSRRQGLPMLVVDTAPGGCLDRNIASLDGVLLYSSQRLRRELENRNNAWTAELARQATIIERAAANFVAEINRTSADIVIEALQRHSRSVARDQMLRVQPLLDQLNTRDRKQVADAIVRAASGTAPVFAKAIRDVYAGRADRARLRRLLATAENGRQVASTEEATEPHPGNR